MRCGCDSDTDSNRAMPTARETSKTQTLRNKGSFFPPLLLVGSQESVFKAPNRGQCHAAIRVTTKRCDSCAQGPRSTRETDGIAAKLLLGAESLVKRYGPSAKHATKVSNEGFHGQLSRTGSTYLGQGRHFIIVQFFQGRLHPYCSHCSGDPKPINIINNFFKCEFSSLNFIREIRHFLG